MNSNLKFILAVLITFLTATTKVNSQRKPKLTIHVINVQQGSAILIRGPEKTLLFDGGKSKYAEKYLIPYLEQLKIKKEKGINYAVISHGDEDHHGGIKELAKSGYDFEKIYDNDGVKKYAGIERKICRRTSCTFIQRMNPGDKIELGDGAYALCVAVRGEIIGGDKVIIPLDKKYENDMSVVLLINYKEFQFIAGGDLGGGDDDKNCTGRSTGQLDIETSVAKALVSQGLIDKTKGLEVMQVNHHGAESSTNKTYMNSLSPKVAIISTGNGQKPNYQHPRKDVVEKVLKAEADCVTVDSALVLQTDHEKNYREMASNSGYIVGDIIIVTKGTKSFAVFGTGRISDYSRNETVKAKVDGWRQFDMD